MASGHSFDLDDTGPMRGRYLVHSSDLGEFELSSDSVIPTFTRWKRMEPIISQFSEEENEAFRTVGYTIGGMMLWPRRSAGGVRSINQERGFNHKIADRMDLTLECVRRHYVGPPSPMSAVLEANKDFFDLFGEFEGFVNHFLLQDLVSADGRSVEFFMPFDDFTGPAIPGDVETYRAYRDKSIAFIRARNQRILDLAAQLSGREGAVS